jgi:hypothetical protein
MDVSLNLFYNLTVESMLEGKSDGTQKWRSTEEMKATMCEIECRLYDVVGDF